MAWAGRALPRGWGRIRVAVMRRDQRRCQLHRSGCVVVATEVDHIGDPDDHGLPNLRAVCHPCHAARTVEQATTARVASVQRRYRPTEASLYTQLTRGTAHDH